MAAMEAILRAAPGLVVVDEAYHAYADASFLPRVAEFPNLVVLRTVSKIGMAGMRLGYAAAAPEWTTELNKVRQRIISTRSRSRRAVSSVSGRCSPTRRADHSERSRLAAHSPRRWS